MQITTERLFLRPFEQSDLERFTEYGVMKRSGGSSGRARWKSGRRRVSSRVETRFRCPRTRISLRIDILV